MDFSRQTKYYRKVIPELILSLFLQTLNVCEVKKDNLIISQIQTKMGCQMRIISYKEVEAKEAEGGCKFKIRWLNNEGSRNFAVRYIVIEPDGYSPHHSHPWEHEIFVLEGNGTAIGKRLELSLLETFLFQSEKSIK